jgi:hypothetical protein
MPLEGGISLQDTHFRRLLENPDYEKPGPHQGPRLVREIPRLANKQEESDARFAAKSPPSSRYAHDPAIRKNVWVSQTTVTLYWDRNTKHTKALGAWDKFFTHRLPSNFKYKSLQYNEYEPSDIAVVYSSYNRHKVAHFISPLPLRDTLRSPKLSTPASRMIKGNARGSHLSHLI